MTKDFCTYHQTRPAIWHCDECARHFCSQCVVVIGDHPQTHPRCPLCEKVLAYLGSGNSAKPFWSVAHKFFLYPFAASGFAFMALVGLLSLLMPFGLLGLFTFLFTVAVAVKYCFAVLESVALGATTAPSVAEAVSGDEDHLFLKLVGLLIVVAFTQAVAEILIDPALGALFAVLFTVVTPAMIMLLAITKEISEALSPPRILGLVASLGWPYLLAVFLTNIISTGPYLVVGLFGETLFASVIALPLLAVTTAYFAVVNFAMLGYLLFEHQGNLGFIAGDPDEERLPATLDNQRKQLIGEVNVLTREGRNGAALQRFASRRSEFTEDMVFYQRYFEFARQCKEPGAVTRAGEPYLELLASRDALDQALDVWREVVSIAPLYKPSNPATAHALAKCAYSKNLLKEALALLVNLHKRAPGYPDLVPAYQLAAAILRDSGNAAKAAQLEKFTKVFAHKRSKRNQPPLGKRAASSAR